MLFRTIRKIKTLFLDVFMGFEKSDYEMSYWKSRKKAEGDLSNTHYIKYFTKHFDLSEEFYNSKKILDVGCGPRGSLEWANNALERVGLDPLVDRYKELGILEHKMKYVNSGSESIPFEDNYFDVVSSFNSLDHVDDLDKTIKEIKRVVKKGGLFLLLSDVNHKPTESEPISFGFDIVDRFRDSFQIVEEKHYEKSESGLYKSIDKNIKYNHENKKKRYGIISCKLLKNR